MPKKLLSTDEQIKKFEQITHIANEAAVSDDLVQRIGAVIDSVCDAISKDTPFNTGIGSVANHLSNRFDICKWVIQWFRFHE